MTAVAEALAPRDHNLPIDPLVLLQQNLEEKNAALLRRRDELLESFGRAPAEIANDDVAGKVGDLIKLITAHSKSADAARVNEKEPHLAAGRAVDGFFKKLVEPLDKAKTALNQRLEPFLRAKAEEARRQEREAAERARQEADRLAQQAQTPAELDTAIAVEASAQAHQESADAKPAEHARTRGDLGSVATLRTTWEVEITDRAALDLNALRPHLATDALEKAARAFVKSGGRKLEGARIFEKQSAVVS